MAESIQAAGLPCRSSQPVSPNTLTISCLQLSSLLVMAESIQAVADDAKADLEEAMPALNAAVDSLKALNKNDITEIKSFPKPPPLVQVWGVEYERWGRCGRWAYCSCEPPLAAPTMLALAVLLSCRLHNHTPPPFSQLTMEAVCILRGEKADWDSAKKLLGESNFMTSLQV